MRLRNKKTGVIGEVGYISTSTGDILVSNIHDQEEWYHYKSLAGLNAEWEDYKEPKDTSYWCIDSLGKIEFHSTVLDEIDGTPNNAMVRKIIGNYFDTREEARQAAEKLKAWKRLKDKGFKFDGIAGMENRIYFKANEQFTHIMVDEYTADKAEKEYIDDLMLLFGSEE